MPPPLPAALPLTVQFVNVIVPRYSLKIPPPPAALLLLTVLLITLSVPRLLRPPPALALLPLTVLFINIAVPPPSFRRPPPPMTADVALLSFTVLLVTKRLPMLS